MSDKLGQEPAFSNVETYNPNNLECNGTYSYGMSKRFYAACAAMQGMLADGERQRLDAVNTARKAYEFADALLKQEYE